MDDGFNMPSLSELMNSLSNTPVRGDNTPQSIPSLSELLQNSSMVPLSSMGFGNNDMESLPTLSEVSGAIPSLSDLCFKDSKKMSEEKQLSLPSLLTEDKNCQKDEEIFATFTYGEHNLTTDNLVSQSPSIAPLLLFEKLSLSPGSCEITLQSVANLSLADLAQHHFLSNMEDKNKNHGTDVLSLRSKKNMYKSSKKGHTSLKKPSNFSQIFGATLILKKPSIGINSLKKEHAYHLPYEVFVLKNECYNVSLDKLSLFSTPSPDEIVKAKQGKAFERDSKPSRVLNL